MQFNALAQHAWLLWALLPFLGGTSCSIQPVFSTRDAVMVKNPKATAAPLLV